MRQTSSIGFSRIKIDIYSRPFTPASCSVTVIFDTQASCFEVRYTCWSFYFILQDKYIWSRVIGKILESVTTYHWHSQCEIKRRRGRLHTTIADWCLECDTKGQLSTTYSNKCQRSVTWSYFACRYLCLLTFYNFVLTLLTFVLISDPFVFATGQKDQKMERR
jgi:hypothetical protein